MATPRQQNTSPHSLKKRSGTSDPVMVDGKHVLTDDAAFEATAKSWSAAQKWWILSVVAACQTSLNYNAAVYSNAVHPLNAHYHRTDARMGMVAFLVTYAFGCEIWAPWSEELGRWPVMQVSLGLVNLSQLLPALSTKWSMVLAGRVVGGLSSAGGSVTLGMVADMFGPDEQQFAVLWASLWSCLGSVIGGICGGVIEERLYWRWNFWIQLLFGGVVQVLHFFCAKETRITILLDREARRRRKNGEEIVYGPNEVKKWRERFHWREIVKTMARPYHMLVCEPIVLCLSLLSGFSDALIFSFLESYGYVYGEGSWNFSTTQFGLAMIPLLVGYILAYFTFFPVIFRHNHRRRQGEELKPESRLWFLLFHVALLPLGLLGSALTITGPPLPWAVPLSFSILIGMANLSIYFSTIDYMVAAYGGDYSASATGGNGFARDFLAGMCALYTKPMYKKLGGQNSTWLLFGVSVLVCIPVYVFYWYGPTIRERSRFAMAIEKEREDRATVKASARWQESGRRQSIPLREV